MNLAEAATAVSQGHPDVIAAAAGSLVAALAAMAWDRLRTRSPLQTKLDALGTQVDALGKTVTSISAGQEQLNAETRQMRAETRAELEAVRAQIQSSDQHAERRMDEHLAHHPGGAR